MYTCNWLPQLDDSAFRSSFTWLNLIGSPLLINLISRLHIHVNADPCLLHDMQCPGRDELEQYPGDFLLCRRVSIHFSPVSRQLSEGLHNREPNDQSSDPQADAATINAQYKAQ